MADKARSQRTRRSRGRGVGFVVGFMTGGVLGAGLGILFAPKSGAQLRRQISEQASSLAARADRRVTEDKAVARPLKGKFFQAVAIGARQLEGGDDRSARLPPSQPQGLPREREH